MSRTLTPRPARPVWVDVAALVGLLAAGVGLFLVVVRAGADLAPAPGAAVPSGPAGPGAVNVVPHVLATMTAVIGLGLVLGRALRWVGQPPVIGEVLAGIVLGPSLLGAISPEAMHALIPSPAQDPTGQVAAAIQAVSQVGIILYMFLVGLEMNAAQLRELARPTLAVCHASHVVPFALGAALALALYPAFAGPGVPFPAFALFVGVALAITAFPMLARILTDRRLAATELGVIALGSAAAGDVAAWCVLVLYVGAAKSEVSGAVGIAVGSVAFIAAMAFVARPLAARLSARFDAAPGPLPPLAVSGTFLAVLVSALAAEAVGIHALFGSFLLGAVVPHDGRIAREFTAKLTAPVTVLLLPAFFATTGMRTQLGLLGTAEDWLWCGGIVLVATVGKFGGAAVAARLTGQTWRNSAALGALMNTRGLMELIVLNIGLDLGVISPTLFTMMVIMALVTTAATSPIVAWLVPTPPEREPVSPG